MDSTTPLPDSEIYLARPETQAEYAERVSLLPSQLALPFPEEMERADGAVDKVARIMQRLSFVKVDRVHVGGSYGRGTTVRGHVDAELTVFVNRLNPAADTDVGMQELLQSPWTLERTARFVEWQLGVPVTRRQDAQQLQLTLDGVELAVALAQNACRAGEAAAGVDRVARQAEALVAPLLRLPDAAAVAAAGVAPGRTRDRALVEALTGLIWNVPPPVNYAIRLFIAWVTCGLAARGLLSSSTLPTVALELIVLHAFHAECSEPSHDLDRLPPGRSLLLRTFLRALDTASRLDEPGGGPVVMLDAGALGYRREEGERFRACWGTEGPFVIHPIDPTCNVARSSGGAHVAWDWAGLAREAGALLAVLRRESLAALLGASTLGAALESLALTERPRPGPWVPPSVDEMQELQESMWDAWRVAREGDEDVCMDD
ncbi:hypothetical protein HYH03_007748 [Edaphochlamys debaryana]|uniref:Uncharacterized protein n=1 Tax=Edaphochlamys debaryana TaxID=47281 RepID=A0A836C056_9CHLO|nr:hypothetical protein HYH03_007748 [Edaphochlamys debaryana]|eukprot:KAG2494109.1 hypothetical protein HYH03_007748 [Edaphochlamys debaryana]